MVEKTEKEVLEKRKKKIEKFFKEKKEWIFYLILTVILAISFRIRTLNISGLKDITTKTWTLGPDLDPFLFLRWAKDIVEYGTLPVMDYMRYIPLGYNTAGEMKLLSYMIAWFYHLLSFFSNNVTVTYAAIMLPAIMAIFTGLAFFLFAREIFYNEEKNIANIIALIATAFFVMIPSLLPRTIAGIPEKESVAFFFMFMAFYFFLKAFHSKKFNMSLTFGVLSGLMTGLMALVWGGVIFVFFSIPPVVLVGFLIRLIDIKKFFIYASWLISAFALMIPFSTRYTPSSLINSTSTATGILVLGLIGISIFLIKTKYLEKFRKKSKLPKEIFYLVFSLIVILFGASVIFGPSFITSQVSDAVNSLITPINTRFGLTVAENKQPFFINDWAGSFGPSIMNIPLYFWLFFSGSVLLFYSLVRKLNLKERSLLAFGYSLFLICLIFSKYKNGSLLDGTSELSVLMYFSGWIIFISSFVYVYIKRFKKKGLDVFKSFDFSYLLYFLIVTLGITGARSGIRLIMVLGAVSPIAVAFLIVKATQRWKNEKDETMRFFMSIITIVILLASIFTIYTYYESNKATAAVYVPGTYQWQWQRAMEWVRANTPENAVFAHWWDYGYWVQSIGKRATILDGGNAIVYWNHLMGRYVLTGKDEMKALEFLYTHNGTHLLIDSTEVGKYTAYSSIGADENYDRFSWISTFLMDDSQTRESANETLYIYTGGTLTDDDILWEYENKTILFPKKKAGIGAILFRMNQDNEILQPQAIFIYAGQQYNVPIRYVYYKDKEYDFGSGIESGIFVFPQLKTTSSGSQEINEIGALFYLSERTVHSEMARLYLYNENSNYFTLAHSEDSLVIESLANQGIDVGEFIYYNGFYGPIKIWDITYPQEIEVRSEFLETDYPSAELRDAKEGEY
ncbi:MAG: hypothetical protein OQK82_04120 [Candidatus Pacearchaeota archaeon]|nr:hypothetical protein [Candidatus Pacearchaeota archaeon]